jgi:hypothetical protein
MRPVTPPTSKTTLEALAHAARNAQHAAATAERDRLVVAAYLAGEPLTAIEAAAQISRTHVYRLLRRVGIIPHRRRPVAAAPHARRGA